MYGAATGYHQQLISGGDDELLRIGQKTLYESSYGYDYVYFNMGYYLSSGYEYQYGQATSITDGYILNNADVMFSPSEIYINGAFITSYDTRHLSLSTNMCLFANDDHGGDVVQNQTATLGTVTITNAYGNITAKYIPMIDENGEPCFYNSVSGNHIYHSGSGTPLFHPGNSEK